MTPTDSPTIVDDLLAALRGRTPEGVARHVLRALVQALEAVGGWIRPWDGWAPWAAVGVDPPAQIGLTPEERQRLERGDPLVLLLPTQVTGPATAALAAQGYGGLLVVPLPGESEPVGVLSLLYAGPPPPDAPERAARLAPLAALVLQQARAARELSQREQLLWALHRIDRALLLGRSLPELAAEAAESARALLGAAAATISLLEGDRRRVVAAAGSAVAPRTGATAPLDGPFAEAARTGQAVWAELAPGEPTPWLQSTAPFASVLVLPLRPDGDVTGFLALFDAPRRTEAQRWGEVVAAQVALALWRERQVEALERQVHDREILLAAVHQLYHADHPDGVLDALEPFLRDRLGADRWALLRTDGERLRVVAAGGGLAPAVGLALAPGQGVAWAAAAGSVVVIADAAHDPRLLRPGIPPLPGPEIFVPLRAPSGALLGALTLGWPPATSPPRALVESLAAVVALALVRAEAELESRLLLQAATATNLGGPLEDVLRHYAAAFAAVVRHGRADIVGHPLGGHPWRLLAVAGIEGDAVRDFFSASFDLAQERWTAWAATQGRTLVVSPETPPPVPPGPLEAQGLARFSTSRWVAVPVGDFAVAYTSDLTGRRPFLPGQIALLERVATLLDAYLQRHRLEVGFARLADLRPGARLLDELVAALAEVLGADAAFVGLLEEGAVRVIARAGTDLQRYLLAGTPCAEVAEGSFCAYERGVAALFAEDVLLSQGGVEGYCGIPLRRSDGSVFGILVALFRRPRRLRVPALQALFESYARRAEAEVEREQRLSRLTAVAEAHARLRPATTLAEIYAAGQAALESQLQVEGLRIAARDAAGQWREFWRSGTPRDHRPIVRPLRAPDGRVIGDLHVWGPQARWGTEEWAFLEAIAEAMGAAHARALALERAQREAERFRALADFSARLETAERPDEVLELALRQLVTLTGAEAALFVRLDDEGRPRLERAVAAPGSAATAPPLPVDWLELAAAPLRGEPSPRAAVVARGGQPIGAVAVVGPLDADLDPAPLVAFVARRLGHAWAQADAMDSLRRTREEALRALGWALEFRDLETKGHTDRVTALALELAGTLGLDETAQRHLRWGAYLHDIGKLAVPDAVLLKADRHTEEEWRLMRLHPVRGEELARRLGFLPEPVLALIRHHHERWDGAGYPDGLAGEAIPLLARIFAVADVYDALVSPRPYKRAWTHAEAVAELRAQAGRQFDPRVVEAFLARWTESSPFS